MCCIFTCCGWMVDLIQRVWTFSMSCIIMSAVIGVLTVSSMSGIALGYNYSLAEYIDLKETNVSVYLKRGVFDDEIADDMDWRRAGHLPVSGQLKEDNLMTGASADESTTLRSGRRLDDSVFEADDQHKYEGSLMKLTARPLHEDLPTQITPDMEMADSLSKYNQGSLDQMKAIQSLIDSRRAMATGGTTLTPLATYASALPLIPYLPKENNPNIPMHPEVAYRRTLAPLAHPEMMYGATTINPARFAVPPLEVIGDKLNWIAPKFPNVILHPTLENEFPSTPTYPTAVTVRPMLVRPTGPVDLGPPDGSVLFPYARDTTRASTQPPYLMPSGQEQTDNKPDFYNEKVLMEGEELSKTHDKNMPKGWKSPEEEYEDEIKGLPVRRRRSIIVSALIGEGRNAEENTINNENLTSVKHIFTSLTTSDELDSKYEDTFTMDENKSVTQVSNDSNTDIDDFNNSNPIINENENNKINLENKVEIIAEHDRNENKKGQSLLEHLVTSIKTKEASLEVETAPNESQVKSTAKDIKINTISGSFESKIVPTKYVSNNLATRLEKKQPFNKGILDSIRISVAKVLQSALTT